MLREGENQGTEELSSEPEGRDLGILLLFLVNEVKGLLMREEGRKGCRMFILRVKLCSNWQQQSKRILSQRNRSENFKSNILVILFTS